MIRTPESVLMHLEARRNVALVAVAVLLAVAALGAIF